MSPPLTPDQIQVVLQKSVSFLDGERQQALATAKLRLKWLLGSAAVAPIAGMIGFFVAVGELNPLPVLVSAVLAAVGALWIYASAASSYRQGFKNLILPHVVAAFGDFQYSPYQGIDQSTFSSTRLYPRPDVYRSEDLVVGRRGATALRFAEVHAQKRQQRKTGDNTTTEYVTIFRGLFFVADFNKDFQGVTYVLPDTAEALFGKFGQSLQSLGASLTMGGGELVRLEDPEFERAFVVYSRDQIEARYLLSSSLMRRLLELRKQCGAFHLCFMGGSIYLAIPNGKTWFEPPPLSTPLNPETLREVTSQLALAIGIVDTLDLNTRIWSKQPQTS